MRVFESIEDIDVDWVKAIEKIDYKYKGGILSTRHYRVYKE